MSVKGMPGNKENVTTIAASATTVRRAGARSVGDRRYAVMVMHNRKRRVCKVCGGGGGGGGGGSGKRRL